MSESRLRLVARKEGLNGELTLNDGDEKTQTTQRNSDEEGKEKEDSSSRGRSSSRKQLSEAVLRQAGQ